MKSCSGSDTWEPAIHFYEKQKLLDTETVTALISGSYNANLLSEGFRHYYELVREKEKPGRRSRKPFLLKPEKFPGSRTKASSSLLLLTSLGEIGRAHV